MAILHARTFNSIELLPTVSRERGHRALNLADYVDTLLRKLAIPMANAQLGGVRFQAVLGASGFVGIAGWLAVSLGETGHWGLGARRFGKGVSSIWVGGVEPYRPP